jgi:signal transduction histidine kinase
MELTTFTAAEGLGANDVYALIAHDGAIFAGTSKGLTIIEPASRPESKRAYYSLRTFGKWQGLNFVDFAENSFTIDKDGRFWAGVDAQILTVMDPIKEDTLAYPTFISGINVLDKKQNFTNKTRIEEKRAEIDTLLLPVKDRQHLDNLIEKDTIYQAQKDMHWKTVEGPYDIPVGLTLPHTQNYLSFSYNGMQLSNSDKMVYRYFLEGIDKNWSPISDKSISENYRDLPPGDYTFKVASKGFNGVWSKPAELQFTILPPWWQTSWAYLLYTSLLILGLIGIDRVMRQRIKRKERERSRDKELAQAKEIEKAYSELKNTQSQLVQSEKMASLGELTAGIAHEIQNPLNFVNNFSEVNSELIAEMKQELAKGNLEEVKILANDIDENEKKIIFHGKRADSIVKGMLQHSRSSSGIKEPTDINALADEYLRLAYHGLRAKDKSFNATMKTDFDPTIGHLNVIPQEMGRVILNLITNAFYAVQEKKQHVGEGYEPTVSVGTRKIGNKVEIFVKDNGNGIPNKVKDKIFQPFFTTKPTGQGTGLGLSMSYDIVTKGHGGTLTLETHEGKGTTFTISIPFDPLKTDKKK